MLARHHPQLGPHTHDWLRLALLMLLFLGGLVALALLFFLANSPLTVPGYMG